MQRLTTKVLALVGLLALLVAMLPAGVALAATTTATANYHATNTGTRFQNFNVGGTGGPYKLQTNLWNKAVSGGFTLTYDTTNTGWSVSNNTANSYFSGNPGTDPNNACTLGSDTFDTTCNWAGTGDPWGGANANTTTKTPASWVQPPITTPNVVGEGTSFADQIHAPASYPDIFRGCHWAVCSPGNGAPFPVQLTGVARLDSVWSIGGDGLTQGTWDASYDIWLDTNTHRNASGNPLLPATPQLIGGSPENIGQNDGAEVMIWVNNNGYTGPGGRITPSGSRVEANKVFAQFPGLHWDVWAARLRSFDNGIRWNVISYVLLEESTGLNSGGTFDSRIFLNDAQNQTCALSTAGTPLAPESKPCLDPRWWITSVQAGFEIWELPSATLTTNSFSVAPVAVSGGMNTGNRALPDGTPLINWGDIFDIQAQGCVGAASDPDNKWSITANNYFPDANNPVMKTISGQLVETPANSGSYISNPRVGPLYNPAAGYILHDNATVTITIDCPGVGPLTTTSSVFIDPSGRVFTTSGEPVVGATVTLLRSDTQNGPFTVVPNNNVGLSQPVMSPNNTSNPSLTNNFGYYRWDVILGWYKVQAQKAGCTVPGSSQTVLTSLAKQVSANLPPITNLDLVLDCGGPLGVQVTTFSDWGAGYCANVTVTNRTAAPVNWQASFPVDGTIYQFWNFTYTPGFQSVTAQGVDWNKALAPGQSTHSVGFCSNRAIPPPPATGQMVQLTTTNDWGTGYCANFKVTNNTAAALNWQVTFPIEGTIYTFWNFTYTRSGNQLTAQGISWNRTLQPGESTHDVGFCANR